MGLLSRLFGSTQAPRTERREPSFQASGNPENPTTPLTDIPSWSEWLGLGSDHQDWAPRVTERTAMSCSAVYRCVTLEAGVIAGLPLKIWKREKDGQRIEQPNHRLAPLLNVIPYQGRSLTAFAWRELWGINVLLSGNHFSAIRYDGAGRVVGFECFQPWQVKVVRVPDKMSDPAFRRMQAQLRQNYAGVSNWGRTIIVDEGAKYTPFQLSPQDLQTIEARGYQVADISRFFGVPLHLLNQTEKTTSWGTGLSENTLAYLIFTLDADLKRIEAELNAKLFASGSCFVEFDREGLLSMDPLKAAQVTAQEISSGQITINEGRAKRSRPPVPGGDTVLVNSTNVPLEQQAVKPQAPPTPND